VGGRLGSVIRKTIGEKVATGDPLQRIMRLRRDAIALYGLDAFAHEPRLTRLRKTFGAAQPQPR